MRLAGPVHQDDVAAGTQALPDTGREAGDVGGVEVVDHLRQQDQVEGALRPIARHLGLQQAQMGQVPAAREGLGQGGLGHVEGGEGAATGRERRRQHPIEQPISRPAA